MQAPFPSLDLHVLSVPPAFILSQDQTLNLIRSLLLGFELTGIFLTVPTILFSQNNVFSSQMLHCSIFKVLTYIRRKLLCNFPSSLCELFPARSACLYYHTVFDLSTTFFKFFNLFSSSVIPCRFRQLLYIIKEYPICQHSFSSFYILF